MPANPSAPTNKPVLTERVLRGSKQNTWLRVGERHTFPQRAAAFVPTCTRLCASSEANKLAAKERGADML